jgi:hypothetical protein
MVARTRHRPLREVPVPSLFIWNNHCIPDQRQERQQRLARTRRERQHPPGMLGAVQLVYAAAQAVQAAAARTTIHAYTIVPAMARPNCATSVVTTLRRPPVVE